LRSLHFHHPGDAMNRKKEKKKKSKKNEAKGKKKGKVGIKI
jgi:hypothetical protein